MAASSDLPNEDPRRIQKPALDHVLRGIYERARRTYEASGAPFGSTEAGLMLWLEFGLDTTRN